jgi:uncharacterized membrane protein YebE (DUF533 family)
MIHHEREFDPLTAPTWPIDVATLAPAVSRPYSPGPTMAKDDDHGLSVAKGVLIALGALAAVGIGLAVLKTLIVPLVVLAVIGGAGYFGYRAFGKTKELQSSRERKALSSSDFDRRMRELDAIDRQLDAEIRKRS